MASGAFKNNAVAIQFIYQQPIEFNVAFPPPLIISGQRMVAQFLGERFTVEQGSDDGFDFVHVFLATTCQAQIFFKPACINRRHTNTIVRFQAA